MCQIVKLLGKSCLNWDLAGEDEVRHGADAGDDDELAQEEQEVDDIV